MRCTKESENLFKVCEITLNYSTSQVVIFNFIRNMVLKGEPDVVNV
jgi:hypothetical protein